MSNHAWCRDPSRDERVRAAEDGKDRPLPTLGEAIVRAFAEAASCGGEGEPYMVTASGIPLYREPPQPRGWLTAEEREAVDAARDYFDDDDHGDSECVFIARVLKQLLARSTPPEVVLPDADCSWCSDYATVWRECLDAVRSSLAATGVVVKEVQ